MDTLTILHAGDYPAHRDLALRLKAGGLEAPREAALALLPLVDAIVRATGNDNVVLIPLPSHTGRPTYMLRVAQTLATLRGRGTTTVFPYLRSQPHESRHALKHGGIPARDIPAASVRYTSPCAAEAYHRLAKTHTAVLLDDIADTGASLRAAQLATGAGLAAVLDTTENTFAARERHESCDDAFPEVIALAAGLQYAMRAS